MILRRLPASTLCVSPRKFCQKSSGVYSAGIYSECEPHNGSRITSGMTRCENEQELGEHS